MLVITISMNIAMLMYHRMYLAAKSQLRYNQLAVTSLAISNVTPMNMMGTAAPENMATSPMTEK